MRAAPLTLSLLVACGGTGNNIGVYNTPPEVSIVNPPDGVVVDEGQVIEFEAAVADDLDRDQDLAIRWSSSKDGELEGLYIVEEGFTRMQTGNLTDGNHDITILVTDTKGESGLDTIQVVVNDLPEAPEVTIVRPATTGSAPDEGLEGERFEFVVLVSDSRDAPGDLSLTFRSDIDGVFCEPVADGVGEARCEAELTGGEAHQLTFTAVDNDGFDTSATTTFYVRALTEVDDDGDGYSEDDGDCDDGDASVNPGATETFNSRDDDCDGTIDEGTEGYDDDGDGFSEAELDCDDDNDDTYPGARETCDGEDNDCDGIVDEETVCYDDDGDGWAERDGDCDDEDGTSFPGGTEVADGADNDCDGVVDEGTTWYDDDGDGYAEIDGDCDDTNAAISPAGTEACGDGVDNDCDGTADEANASGCTTYYYDYDGDGYGTTSGRCLCTQTGYYTSSYSTDCYDSNASANPGATSWFTNDRGDGSFDYNCDGSQAKYYNSRGSCSGGAWICSTSAGWDGSVTSCGNNGTWIYNCSGFLCDEDTTTRQQSCR